MPRTSAIGTTFSVQDDLLDADAAALRRAAGI